MGPPQSQAVLQEAGTLGSVFPAGRAGPLLYSNHSQRCLGASMNGLQMAPRTIPCVNPLHNPWLWLQNLGTAQGEPWGRALAALLQGRSGDASSSVLQSLCRWPGLLSGTVPCYTALQGAQITESPRCDAGWSGPVSSLRFVGDTENTLQENTSHLSPKWGYLPGWPAG